MFMSIVSEIEGMPSMGYECMHFNWDYKIKLKFNENKLIVHLILELLVALI